VLQCGEPWTPPGLDLGDAHPGQDAVKGFRAVTVGPCATWHPATTHTKTTARQRAGSLVSREGAPKPHGVHVDGAPGADLGLPRCSRLGKCPKAAAWVTTCFWGAVIPCHAAVIRKYKLHHADFQRKFGGINFLSPPSMFTELRSFE